MPEPQDGAENVVYANWARTEATPFDLAVDLGYRTAPGPPSHYPVRVIMSWEQAVSLRDLLDHVIAEYQEEVGPIRDLEGEIGDARATEEGDE